MSITVRKHPAELAGPLILVVGGLAAAGELTRRSVRPKIVWGAYLSVLLYSLQRVAAWQATYFTVTDTRMILVSGFAVRKVSMMPLTKVTDMSFQRSALGRLLGYGEFIVESAGEKQPLRTIDFVPYPDQLYLEVCGLVFPGAVAETEQDQDDLPD